MHLVAFDVIALALYTDFKKNKPVGIFFGWSYFMGVTAMATSLKIVIYSGIQNNCLSWDKQSVRPNVILARDFDQEIDHDTLNAVTQ